MTNTNWRIFIKIQDHNVTRQPLVISKLGTDSSSLRGTIQNHGVEKTSITVGEVIQKDSLPRNNFLPEIIDTPVHLENIGPIDRISIVRHILLRVSNKYEKRYSVLLKSEVVKVLEEKLNPAVREICDNGRFTLDRYAPLFSSRYYIY